MVSTSLSLADLLPETSTPKEFSFSMKMESKLSFHRLICDPKDCFVSFADALRVVEWVALITFLFGMWHY